MIPQVGGFQGCYLDNHRNNWRCARAVRKRPLSVCVLQKAAFLFSSFFSLTKPGLLSCRFVAHTLRLGVAKVGHSQRAQPPGLQTRQLYDGWVPPRESILVSTCRTAWLNRGKSAAGAVHTAGLPARPVYHPSMHVHACLLGAKCGNASVRWRGRSCSLPLVLQSEWFTMHQSNETQQRPLAQLMASEASERQSVMREYDLGTGVIQGQSAVIQLKVRELFEDFHNLVEEEEMARYSPLPSVVLQRMTVARPFPPLKPASPLTWLNRRPITAVAGHAIDYGQFS